MRLSIDPVQRPWLRRLVLGCAVLAACCAVASRIAAPVDAAEIVVAVEAGSSAAAPSTARAAAAPSPADAPAPPGPAGSASPVPAVPAAPAVPDASDDTSDPEATRDGNATSEVTIGKHGVTVHKNGKRVNVQAFGADREYDSFQDFVNDAPWLAALVFMVVLLLFLTPLLIVVLLIWYKIRRTRMQNETMVKLAERGMVAPPEVMERIVAATGAMPAGASGNVPLYEQARALRRRAAWSDLRKGVVLLAVGLGLSFFSMLDDGTPNSVGLVLLFLGIGYCLLWFFEDRQAAPVVGSTGVAGPRDAGAPPAGSA
jgi:hypothetical protein